jgi:putative peptide zinc metalloprotease protein
VIEAYVAEADLARVHIGATALFYPLNDDAPVELQVTELAPASTRVLPTPELAPLLPTRRDKDGALLPTEAVYRVLLRPTVAMTVTRRMQGHVVIEGDRSSLLGNVWRRVVSVVIRESNL